MKIKIHKEIHIKLESYEDLEHRDLCFIFLGYDKNIKDIQNKYIEYIYIFINKMF